MSAVTRSLIAFALLIAPDVAVAHAPFDGVGGFYGGLLHPLFVPAHVLAILGVGLLTGKQAPRWHWATPIAYAAGLVGGFVAIASAYVPTLAGETVLATAFVTGALVALASPLPQFILGPFALITGLAIALDSPPEVISVREAIVMQIGIFCGATILLIVIVECASRLRRDWQRIGVRILGSWIAASAILVLALQLAK